LFALYLYTAVSTKVVPQKRKSARDNAVCYYRLKEFGVDWLRFSVFTNKKTGEDINLFVCAVSLYVAEKPKASVKDHEPHYP